MYVHIIIKFMLQILAASKFRILQSRICSVLIIQILSLCGLYKKNFSGHILVTFHYSLHVLKFAPVKN